MDKPILRSPLKGRLVDSDTPSNEPFWKPQKPYPAPQQCRTSSSPRSFPGTFKRVQWAHKLLLLERECVQYQQSCLSVEIGQHGLHPYCLDKHWWMVHAGRRGNVSSFPMSTGRWFNANFPQLHFKNGLKRTANKRKMAQFEALTFNWDKSRTSSSQWLQPFS